MDDRIRLIAGGFALLYLAFLVSKLRQQQLSVSSSLLWLISGFLLIMLTLFPDLIRWAAGLAGFQVASNAVFVLWLLVLTSLSFGQSIALSRCNDQLRRVAQDNALLRLALGDAGTERGESARRTLGTQL